MNNQKETNNNIDWEEVILSLQSYVRSLVNGKGWFRGKKTTTFLKGKEIDDYVFGAIEKYLRNPEKYNPSKGSLINFLKYNLIRSMVSNDLVSSENKSSKDVFQIAENKEHEEDNSNSYLDSIFPFAEVYFDQEIDYANIISSIELEIKDDKIAEEIFFGICYNNLKRREVIEEFEMSEKDFDNGMRRLKTVLNNIAKKFDLKNQSV